MKNDWKIMDPAADPIEAATEESTSAPDDGLEAGNDLSDDGLDWSPLVPVNLFQSDSPLYPGRGCRGLL